MLPSKEFTFEIYEHEGTEALFVSKKDAEKTPLIILIHGFNRFGAWELLWQAQRLIRSGYSVLLPSQIGFGGSIGSRDYCGPSTISGIGNLLQDFTENSKHHFSKTIIWGASRGALVAGSLLTQYPTLFSAGVLQAGIYDLKKDYEWKDKPNEIKKNIEDESGVTEENFLQRTPLKDVSKIQCPLLLMHGLDDTTVSYVQTEILSTELSKYNIQHELHLLKEQGHHLNHPVLTKKYVLPFLESI